MYNLMDTKFYRNSELSDNYVDLVREILGLTLFEIADPIEDMFHNTDLILHSPHKEDIRVAQRIRSNKYFKEHPNDFTIRCQVGSKVDTEFQKIMGTCKGKTEFGDYLFYGFENETHDGLIEWFIGDINIFRKVTKGKLKFKHTNKNDSNLGDLTLNGETIGHSKRVREHSRRTGDIYYNYFLAIDRRKIPGFVIACKEDFKWPIMHSGF